MNIPFPGGISAKRIACFRDHQYFHCPEEMARVGRRPIIQGLDIMTQLLGRMTDTIGMGFSVQFCNPISGGDSIDAKVDEDGALVADGPQGDILSREQQATLLRDPIEVEELEHYPFQFVMKDSLARFGKLFGIPILRDRLAYLLAIGAHSGALVDRFSRSDAPEYKGTAPESVNEYFAELRRKKVFPLFLDIKVRNSGEGVGADDTLEFATRFAPDVGESRYGKVSVFCKSGRRQLFQTDVQFMMLPTQLINRRYSQPLV